MSGLAAVLMACAHAMFQLPAGVLGLVFYSRAVYSPQLFSAFVIVLSASAVGSLTDFLIYTFIYRAFRRRVADLFRASFRLCSFCRCARDVALQHPVHIDNGTHYMNPGATLAGNASLTHRGPSNSSIDLEDRSHSSLRIELAKLRGSPSSRKT